MSYYYSSLHSEQTVGCRFAQKSLSLRSVARRQLTLTCLGKLNPDTKTAFYGSRCGREPVQREFPFFRNRFDPFVLLDPLQPIQIALQIALDRLTSTSIRLAIPLMCFRIRLDRLRTIGLESAELGGFPFSEQDLFH